MNASPGWDSPPPVENDSDRLPYDHTSEPVGYNLGEASVYEQPPLPPQPYRLPTVAPTRTGEVAWGFMLSLLGLAALAFITPLAVTFGASGALTCAVALIRSRRGAAINRGLAIAGLVLGIVTLALVFLVVPVFYISPGTLRPS